MKIFSREILIKKILKRLNEIKRRYLIMNKFEALNEINEEIKYLESRSTEYLIKTYKKYI